MNWQGKIAVVTGAAKGIGRALAEELLAGGAQVWALDLDEKGLSDLKEQAKKFGQDLQARKVDVTSDGDLKSVQNEIRAQGKGLHVWINNAGISGLGTFEEMTQEAFDRVLNINFRATVVGTRLALEVMEPFGAGSIVNVASVAGFIPVGYLTAYCASKSAVVAFTKSLRSELSLKNLDIDLVIVAPGFVDTGMIEKGSSIGFPEWLEWSLTKPEKVAKMVLKGVSARKLDLFPTWNGKAILAAHKIVPGLHNHNTKLLLPKRLKDLVMWRLTPPK